MLILGMNLDQLYHFVDRMRTLRFELALFQEEILALEFDHAALAEAV
jgi:hypothetical protein